MKKGDVVVIDDGSFSRQIKDNKLTRGPGGDKYKPSPDYCRKQYVIIETNCSFPGTGSWNSFNNTVIQAIDSGKVVFIEERFLELALPIHKVFLDVEHVGHAMFGVMYKISDKLYKEIKRDS